MPNLNHDTIELIFIGVVAVSIFLQMIVLLAILVALRKAAGKIGEQIDDLRNSVMPLIDNTHDLLDNTRDLYARLAPKVEKTVDDIAILSKTVKDQTLIVSASAQQLMIKAQKQTDRVDGMITSALNAVDRSSAFLMESVSRPVKQLSSILAAAKAIVESLSSEASAPLPHRSPATPPPPQKPGTDGRIPLA